MYTYIHSYNNNIAQHEQYYHICENGTKLNSTSVIKIVGSTDESYQHPSIILSCMGAY